MTAATFWCDQAWLGGPAAAEAVRIDTDGGRITAVTVGAPRPPEAQHLAGLTLPGLANGHSHAFHRALRGRTQGGTGSFWTWRDQMYQLAERLDPDSCFRLARAVYGEMLLAGITSVAEFHYVHHGPGGVPYSDPNAMSHALAAAAAEAGVRLTLLDTCYLHGGIEVELGRAQRRFSDGTAAAWRDRVEAFDAPGVVVGAAVHSVRAVHPEAVGEVAAWAAAHDAPLHAHVSEQPAENARCLEAYGLTPTQLLASRGALGPRFTAVHATHLDPDDIRLLGEHGATVCVCPTTERDLADGIGPTAALARAGARLTVGTDSHAVVDLFEETRAVEWHQRLSTHVRGVHPTDELWRAATNHDALGRPDAGQLAPGMLADLLAVRLDTVRTAGDGPALDTVLHAATAADVHRVVVGGHVLASDGVHARVDVPGELARTVRSLQEQP